jgi:endonuclease-8
VPEGDTIFRTAATLRRAILGEEVLAARAPSGKRIGRYPIERLIGSKFEAIEPRGKHLLMRFSNGLLLHSHMQMAGSWHLYRPGERWRLPGFLARAVLRTAEFEAVCFSAPILELVPAQEEATHGSLANLGPDLLAADFDPVAARERLKALQDTEIAPALLDQRALAGIGNVYKSEVLFTQRLSPFLRVAELDDEELDALIAEGVRLMRANLVNGARVTTGSPNPGQALWVYGRPGRPCRRCQARIRAVRQAGRMTFWCPDCQP